MIIINFGFTSTTLRQIKDLEKIVKSGFDGNILLEYTFLCGYYGIPTCMIKDMKRLKKKVDEAK